MSDNLIQFAPIFDAVGATINLDTSTLKAEIIECPPTIRALVQSALAEIDKFLDTCIYNDGLAIFAIADFIDGDPNPIHDLARASILDNVGLTREGRYISQVLSLLKTNKSWHSSEVPNTCSYFDSLCTHRGITEVEGKRGRKSNRSPDDYHIRKTNGTISREQLVTPYLEAVHRAIPAESLVSVVNKTRTIVRLDRIDELEPEELHLILEKINAIEAQRNAAI